MEENHIYQYSLLTALMEGVSEGGIDVQKLKSKGNQGVGTFSLMNGELIFLDGQVYQLLAEGKVREADSGDRIPFVVSAQFKPNHTLETPLLTKASIDQVLDKFDPNTANLFVTYRIDALFQTLKCRTVRGQEYKGQPLSELGQTQYVHTYNDVEGTVIGFRSPQSWQGFNVAGEHLHFIAKDRSCGGHVLELEARSATMGFSVVSNIHVELPTSEDFNLAKLALDDAGIRKVEG